MTATKIAPTEPKSREQREARVAASKKLIDNTTRVKAKGIGKAVNIKTVEARALQGRSGRGQMRGRAVGRARGPNRLSDAPIEAGVLLTA
jgi:hypothetical protein